MTKTYLIHAWCVRPFIACLDPVEAATPEEAIAAARHRPDALLDSAEECNAQYPWDEFAAYDESGSELLRVLDAEARVRNAAPAMRDALEYVAQTLGGFKPDSLTQLGLDVAMEKIENALAIADSNGPEALAPVADDNQD
jgi:hypothetical protein